MALADKYQMHPKFMRATGRANKAIHRITKEAQAGEGTSEAFLHQLADDLTKLWLQAYDAAERIKEHD